MKKLITVLTLCFGFVFQSMAHQGHDHDAPTTIKAPQGGIIKALDESRIEVVTSGSNFKIYLYDAEMKPALASRFKIEAQAQLPRSKKKESISLTAQDKSFEGVYDAKKAHRYTLILTVTDSVSGHTDKLNYVIEKRK